VLDLRLASEDDPGSRWLTRVLDFRSIGALASSYAFGPTLLTADYDALIFFDQTTPSRLLVRPSGAMTVAPNR